MPTAFQAHVTLRELVAQIASPEAEDWGREEWRDWLADIHEMTTVIHDEAVARIHAKEVNPA